MPINPVVFNWVVILQIWIWMFLYSRKNLDLEKFRYPFLISAIASILSLGILGLYGLSNISNYPVPLVLFYMTAVLMSYLVLEKKGLPFHRGISLAFLLVFFSSYFWEGPLHLLDLLSFGLTSRFVIQTLHILPVIFLSQYYKVQDWKILVNWILLANMITLGIVVLEMIGILQPFIIWTFLIRGLDLVILLKIFLDPNIIKKKNL
jgi:hypothetical protein